ncbi:MAG: ABC transporter permease [Bacteroidota bacterium]
MEDQPTYYNPPENVMRFLRWYCAASFLEEIEGDLFELFQEEVEIHGLKKASRQFVWTALRYLNPYFFGKKDLSLNLEHHLTMLQHYFKIAVRHLWKQRLYSVINILGLAIGVACCLTVLYYITDEIGYDSHHENADDLYRISLNTATLSGGVEQLAAISPVLWGPALKKDYPVVEDFARFVSEVSPDNPWEIINGETSFTESEILFADPSALKLFTFPMIHGDPNTALNEPMTIVLTKKMALKYFNDENPTGKTLIIDPKIRGNDGQFTNQTFELTVSAVLEDLPRNTHLTFEFLVPSIQLNQLYGIDINGNGEEQRWFWRGLNAHTYIKLNDGTDPTVLEEQFQAFQDRYLGDDTRSRGYVYYPYLQNIKDIHLDEEHAAQLNPTGSRSYILIFSIIAFFVLCIASINFMNLSTARAATRAKEVGLRKVVGASFRQLVNQFMGESLIITFLAIIIGLLLTRFTLPIFFNFIEKDLAIQFNNYVLWALIILGLGTLVGLLAGLYPAIVLSRFRPIDTIKGNFIKSKNGSFLRKGLVVFQFLLSAILIIVTLTLFKQINYMRSYDLGFDKEHVMVITPNTARSVANKYETLKTELSEDPAIADVTMTSGMPGFSIGGDNYGEAGAPVESAIVLAEIFVDYNYLDFFKLDLIAGRNFDRNLGTDAGSPRTENSPPQLMAIVNEEAIRQFGWANPEEALGKQIFRDPNAKDWAANVIGVVKDFHVQTLQQDLSPTAIILRPNYNYLAVKLNPGDIAKGVASVEKTIKAFAPEVEFDYAFLDENFNQQYVTEQRLSKAFTQISLLAILIACMGLFGLAAFSTAQRIKEIGVRKTLGASLMNIVFLLSKDFTRLVLIAVVIAIPISYFITEKGLENFAYRINIRPEIYLFALLIALSIAFLTVSFHTLKAAMSNPVKSLRTE